MCTCTRKKQFCSCTQKHHNKSLDIKLCIDQVSFVKKRKSFLRILQKRLCDFQAVKSHVCAWFVSECSEVECQRGARCQVVPSTGQPYCYPTCEVDNGGCHGTCQDLQPFCNATDEPCQNMIGCVGPSLFIGMEELKCTLIFIYVHIHIPFHVHMHVLSWTHTHTHTHKHTLA